jgi:hypothetical protein
MSRPGRGMGAAAIAPRESSETRSTDAAKTMPERRIVSESVKIAATVSPTESEIAAVAYELWLDNGCPNGSDQEDWLRAEAMLKNALVARCEGPSERPSVPRGDTRMESVIVVDLRWNGHWEAWESEWGAARWIWD